MDFLGQRLAPSGSTGLCLEVMPQNIDALNFYNSVGFEMLQDVELPNRCVHVAKRLTSAPDVAGWGLARRSAAPTKQGVSRANALGSLPKL
jgi:hypothetical protein